MSNKQPMDYFRDAEEEEKKKQAKNLEKTVKTLVADVERIYQILREHQLVDYEREGQ